MGWTGEFFFIYFVFIFFSFYFKSHSMLVDGGFRDLV